MARSKTNENSVLGFLVLAKMGNVCCCVVADGNIHTDVTMHNLKFGKNRAKIAGKSVFTK